jgi:pimeloyl-ACP methyl ester carboxylesterase
VKLRVHRRVRQLLVVVGALIVLGVGLLLVSSRLSLDADYAHTRGAEALPPLSTGISQGLVQIRARGLSFRARVAGLDREGPALLLLHGFPETSIMWQPLMEVAARAGLRVVAFDQRGYSPLARPTDVEAYRLPELVADVFAVADAVGFERFHLVGHDWGAIVGWAAAGQDHVRVRSYVSLSIPHPGAIRVANEGQGAPAYVRFFRMPGIPETLFTSGGLAPMRTAMYAAMPSDQVDEYVSVFSEPGALRAALNWYRAMPSEFLSGPDLAGEVVQPVLSVFGTRDLQVFTRAEVRQHQPRFVTGPYTPIELDSGHWLIQERPAEVVDAVMRHLAALDP